MASIFYTQLHIRYSENEFHYKWRLERKCPDVKRIEKNGSIK